MSYLKISTGTYPLTERDIQEAFPNVSFEQPFKAPEDYAVVFPAPAPAHNALAQSVREIAPELTSLGHWEQRWEVVALPDESIAANMADAVQKLQDGIVTAVQARLDTFFQTRHYDNVLSAATYATSSVPAFRSEGQYAVNARDATWSSLYQILAQVQAGTRPMPTGYADIEGDLPVLAWPVVA